MKKNLIVGVLCGGDSSERGVSLRSGRAVHQALVESGVDAERIDPKRRRTFQRSLSRLDVAFIALHGRGGEDGTLQSRLERARIPYVGSAPRGSRLAFNKVEAKRIFDRTGILTPPWTIVNAKNWRRLRAFGTPFFVKPVADGSSIGVFCVEDFVHSAEKIIRALTRYPVLLVEKKIKGREFTVGVLGKRALPVVELRPKRPFYDYRAKYTRGMTEYRVPAPLTKDLTRKLQRLALKVHRVLGLRDLSRIDFMVDGKGRSYVLEANTIPGFTELSLLPKAAQEAGISFESLCLKLVKMAWSRRNKNGKAKA